MKPRLYVVVRADLPPGLQLAQACHATREFGLRYPGLDLGDNLVVLQVPGEAALHELLLEAGDRDLPAVAFAEPDLHDELTAAAFSGDARALLSSLPLALRAA
jgi:hypothetical protein